VDAADGGSRISKVLRPRPQLASRRDPEIELIEEIASHS